MPWSGHQLKLRISDLDAQSTNQNRLASTVFNYNSEECTIGYTWLQPIIIHHHFSLLIAQVSLYYIEDIPQLTYDIRTHHVNPLPTHDVTRPHGDVASEYYDEKIPTSGDGRRLQEIVDLDTCLGGLGSSGWWSPPQVPHTHPWGGWWLVITIGTRTPHLAGISGDVFFLQHRFARLAGRMLDCFQQRNRYCKQVICSSIGEKWSQHWVNLVSYHRWGKLTQHGAAPKVIVILVVVMQLLSFALRLVFIVGDSPIFSGLPKNVFVATAALQEFWCLARKLYSCFCKSPANHYCWWLSLMINHYKAIINY